MKNIFLLVILAVNFTFGFSQSFENKKITLKYYKPAFIEEAVPETFSVQITQTLGGETSAIQAKDGGSDKEQFYHNKYKSVLKGSLLTAENGGFLLEVVQGEPKIISKKSESYAITDANGAYTGTAWRINMMIELAKTYIIKDAEGKEIYRDESTDKRNYVFPTYLGPAKYKSQKSVEDAAVAQETAILNSHIKLGHKTNKFTLKDQLKADLVEQYDKITLNVVTPDLSKKERAAYADVIELTDRMFVAFDKINLEAKNETKKNWHTSELKAEFVSLAEGWTKVIEDEVELQESKKGARFQNKVLQGITKNQLWCEFFASNFDPVLEYAQKFWDMQRETFVPGQNVGEDLKIQWDDMKKQSAYYNRVFLACSKKQNWE